MTSPSATPPPSPPPASSSGAARRTGRRTSWVVAVVAVVVALVAAAAGFGVGRATGDDSGSATARTTPAGRTAAAAPAGTKSTKARMASVLLVLETATSWATPVDADTGTYDVHLRDADIRWFEDRPGRESGTFLPAQLAAMWHGLFAGDPPNGSVVFGVRTGEPPAIEITDMRYDAPTGTLTVRVRPDRGQSVAGLDGLGDLGEATAATNGRTTLFVDDIYIETLAGCVLSEGGQSQCPGWQVPPGTNFSGGWNLEYSDFEAADFAGIDMSNSYVYYDNFEYANLAGANLSGANVSGANFTNANLTGVNWSGTLWCQYAVGAVEAGCVPYPSG